MINPEQVITVSLSASEMAFVSKQAGAACMGGRSQVRAGASRQGALSEDQLVGQVGTYAGHKALFGNATLYKLSRYFANIYPMQGDGGSDVPGANIDFKASLMRAERPMLDYRLPVRPAERHAGMIYVLVLVDLANALAHIIGWVAESSLPAQPTSEGVFAGAFVVRAGDLNPVMPIKWF